MESRLLCAVCALAAILLFGCSTLPPWKPVPTGQSAIYGQIEDTTILVRFISFSDDPRISAISVENKRGRYAPRYTLLLDQGARNALKEALSKYRAWAGVAEKNGVEITKEITTLTLPQMTRQGSSWDPGGSRELVLTFTSKIAAESSQQVHLVLRSSTFFSGRDQLVLSDEQARDFDGLIQDTRVSAGYEQAKKKQDAIDMFK